MHMQNISRKAVEQLQSGSLALRQTHWGSKDSMRFDVALPVAMRDGEWVNSSATYVQACQHCSDQDS
jgi:hypothetical protein